MLSVFLLHSGQEGPKKVQRGSHHGAKSKCLIQNVVIIGSAELKIFVRPLFVSQLFPSFCKVTRNKCPKHGHLHLEPVMHDCRTAQWFFHHSCSSHHQPEQAVEHWPFHGCWCHKCLPCGAVTQSDAHLHHWCHCSISDWQANSGSDAWLLIAKLHRWQTWLVDLMMTLPICGDQLWLLNFLMFFPLNLTEAFKDDGCCPTLMTMHTECCLPALLSAWSSWQEQEKGHHQKSLNQSKSQIGLLRQQKAMHHGDWSVRWFLSKHVCQNHVILEAHWCMTPSVKCIKQRRLSVTRLKCNLNLGTGIQVGNRLNLSMHVHDSIC